LTLTHLESDLSDQARRADLSLQMMAALVHQLREFLGRRQSQSGGPEDDHVQDAFRW
jgi:hypothetical protein